jgi:hypothetical protein
MNKYKKEFIKNAIFLALAVGYTWLLLGKNFLK